MQLRPGMAEEYRRRHEALWPEMRDMIRAHGGRNYSIFLDSDTDTLVGYIEIENEDLWAASARTDVCRRWWDYMAPLMVVNSDNSPVTHTLESIFHID